MANYCCAMRSNYFRVKDPDEFRSFICSVCTTDDALSLWEKEDASGNKLFAFGSYGNVCGFDDIDDDVYDNPYDEFVRRLQRCVADDDAIVILEAGNENLRYVVGFATIVTSNSVKTLDLSEFAVSTAALILENNEWHTEMDY